MKATLSALYILALARNQSEMCTSIRLARDSSKISLRVTPSLPLSYIGYARFQSRFDQLNESVNQLSQSSLRESAAPPHIHKPALNHKSIRHSERMPPGVCISLNSKATIIARSSGVDIYNDTDARAARNRYTYSGTLLSPPQ